MLEVLIAFAIAAAALAALFHVFSVGVLTQSEANRLTSAVALAEEQLTLAEQGSRLGNGSEEGRTTEGFTWRRSIQPLAMSMGPAGDSGPLAAYEVQVTVSWDEAREPKSITLRSLALGRRS